MAAVPLFHYFSRSDPPWLSGPDLTFESIGNLSARHLTEIAMNSEFARQKMAAGAGDSREKPNIPGRFHLRRLKRQATGAACPQAYLTDLTAGNSHPVVWPG